MNVQLIVLISCVLIKTWMNLDELTSIPPKFGDNPLDNLVLCSMFPVQIRLTDVNIHLKQTKKRYFLVFLRIL